MVYASLSQKSEKRGKFISYHRQRQSIGRMIYDAKNLPEKVRREEKRAKRKSLLKKAAIIASGLVLASATTYYAGKIFANPSSTGAQAAKIYTNDDVELIYAKYQKERQAPGKNIDDIVADELKKNGQDNPSRAATTKSERSEYGFLEKSVENKIEHWKNTVTKSTDKFTWTKFDSVKERFSNTTEVKDYISDSAKKWGIDEEFYFHHIAWEGGEGSKEHSVAGAAGWAQITKKMGLNHGFIINKYIDERFNPQKSIDFGGYLLDDARSRWGDNKILLIADYNWGGGHVKDLLESMGIRRPEKIVVDEKGRKHREKQPLPKLAESVLEDIFYSLPDETQEHCIKVFATIKMAKNSQKYGFTYESKSSLKQIIESSLNYAVKKGDTAYIIAKENNLRLEDLKKKNPELQKITKIRPGLNIRI